MASAGPKGSGPGLPDQLSATPKSDSIRIKTFSKHSRQLKGVSYASQYITLCP